MPKTLARGAVVQNKSKENETFPAINELQKVANSVYRAGPFTVSASDAIAHIVWTSEDMPEGALWSFIMSAQAQGTGMAHIVRSALWSRPVGGIPTQFGTGTAISTNRTDANIQLQNTTVGNSVAVQVIDASARTLSWAVWIEVRVST